MELMSRGTECSSVNFSEINESLTSSTRGNVDRYADRIDPDVIQRLEAVDDDTEFETELHALEDVHPGDPILWRVRVRRLLKRKLLQDAIALIDVHDFGEAEDELRLLEKAELLHDAR